MELVAKLCPNIRKIMFQLNNEYVTDISQIYLPFKNLSEIHQWGGDFYADKVNKFIEEIGHQLKVLYFIHVGKNFWDCKIFKSMCMWSILHSVDEIDLAALSLISNKCINLETFGLYNCIFRELHLSNEQIIMNVSR